MGGGGTQWESGCGCDRTPTAGSPYFHGSGGTATDVRWEGERKGPASVRHRDRFDDWLDEAADDLAQRGEPTITVETARLRELILELRRARLVHELFIRARQEQQAEDAAHGPMRSADRQIAPPA